MFDKYVFILSQNKNIKFFNLRSSLFRFRFYALLKNVEAIKFKHDFLLNRMKYIYFSISVTENRKYKETEKYILVLNLHI